MALKFGADELAQMKRIENELARVLATYRENTEAALPAIALIRCARVLVRLYPKTTELQLTRVLVDYLEGRAAPRDDPYASLVVMPMQ